MILVKYSNQYCVHKQKALAEFSFASSTFISNFISVGSKSGITTKMLVLLWDTGIRALNLDFDEVSA